MVTFYLSSNDSISLWERQVLANLLKTKRRALPDDRVFALAPANDNIPGIGPPSLLARVFAILAIAWLWGCIALAARFGWFLIHAVRP